ncbi:MAG: hypothetical protein KA285_00880 [Bacteroidia bacterium]|nr:hypothetical protein [Bacteroidia bacterium]
MAQKKKGKKNSTELSKQNIGNAGEYYIAFQLSLHNFITTITLGRAEKFDILTLSPSNQHVKLSIKTTQRTDSISFPLSKKDELGASDDFFYAFVKFREENDPDWWIIPSKRVNAVLQNASEIYFNTMTQKDGSKHNDKGIRRLDFVPGGKRGKSKRLEMYDQDWVKELESYYKNIKQLLE